MIPYLDDTVSRTAAVAGSATGGLLAVAAQTPFEQIGGLLAAVLLPIAIAAVNRWVDRRYQVTTLRAALAAAEETARQLRERLAQIEASQTKPEAD